VVKDLLGEQLGQELSDAWNRKRLQFISTPPGKSRAFADDREKQEVMKKKKSPRTL
jgi:hypothetical protein